MGLGPVVGMFLLLIGLFVGAIFKGVSPVTLITNVPALLIVCVGTMGATMMSFPLKETTGVFKAIMKAFKPGPETDVAALVDEIAELSDQARKEGLLALESKLGSIQQPLLRQGLQMAVDGSDPSAVEAVLAADIEQRDARHKGPQAWLVQAGIFSPTLGIIGAVLGLIATLGHLNEPELLGHGIAAAFVATFWGVFLANGIFLPIANNLKRLSAAEKKEGEMIVEGVLAIQAGHNSRHVRELLSAYLPPAQRKKD